MSTLLVNSWWNYKFYWVRQMWLLGTPQMHKDSNWSVDIHVHRRCLLVCNECTKAVKKLVRLKTTTEMELTENINNSLQEIKSTLSDLKAKSTTPVIPPQPNLLNVNSESSPKIDTSLEIKISGIPEFSSQPNSKYSDIMQHEIKETQRIIDFLGENENKVSNIRRLGKFTKSSSKPRSLLVTFNNSWTVRKLIANAHKIKYINQDNGTKTMEQSKSLTKEEQIKEKECLIKRYKLINEEGYLRNKFRIFNQKLFYDGTEIEVCQWWLNVKQESEEYLESFVFNIRSIINRDKRTKLANYVISRSVDFFMLTETWLHCSFHDNELFLPNYAIFRSERKADNNTSKHGGVLIAIKNTFVSREIPLYTSVDGGVLACSLSFNSRDILLVCFYAPPNYHVPVLTLYHLKIVIYCLRKSLHCQSPSNQQLCMVISICRKLIGTITQLRTQIHRNLLT